MSDAVERYRSEYVAKCDLEQGKAQMTDTGSQCGMQEAVHTRRHLLLLLRSYRIPYVLPPLLFHLHLRMVTAT